MNAQEHTSPVYFLHFARGAGLVLALVWLCMSFAPLIDLAYDKNGTPALLNWGLVATSMLGILVCYGAAMVLAAKQARASVHKWFMRQSHIFAAHGASWIIVYTFIA